MGQRVAAETVIGASPADVYGVIADLEAYPEWAHDVLRTEVVEQTTDGLPELVAFAVDARIATVHYVLQYQHDPPHRVRWRLVEGEMLSQLDGSYRLAPAPDGTTTVRYELEADLALPLPSYIQRRAARVILETGLSGLRDRVEGR
jgi:ribosome-associated toxin RatA of RatAB toxin-antitoxin module